MKPLSNGLAMIATTCQLDASDRLLNGGEELREQVTIESSRFISAVARADHWIYSYVIQHLAHWAPKEDVAGGRSAICACYRALFARILLGDHSIESWQDLNQAQVLSLDATLRRLYEQQQREFQELVFYVHSQNLEPPARYASAWEKYITAGRARRTQPRVDAE